MSEIERLPLSEAHACFGEQFCDHVTLNDVINKVNEIINYLECKEDMDSYFREREV